MSDRATRTRRKSTRLSAVFSPSPPSPPARDVDLHHQTKTSSSSRIGVQMNASNSSSSSSAGARGTTSAATGKRASNTSTTGSTSTTAGAGNTSSRRANNSNNTTSADLIPTIRNRVKGRATAAKELVNSAPRFEDFLDDEHESADRAEEPSFMAAASATRAAGRGRAKAQNGRAAAATKRKRGGEDEVDGIAGVSGKARAGSGRARKSETDPDGFRFAREERGSSSPSRRAAKQVPYTSTRTLEELPADILGETPIAKRNRARRAGLDGGLGLGQPSSSSSLDFASEDAPFRSGSGAGGRGGAGSKRRDSLGLKGARRVSSLRNGSIAHPHGNVPDEMLYRHCSSAAMDPVSRMKYLLAWCLDRSIDTVFDASEDVGAKGKGKGKRKTAQGSTTEELEKRKLIEPILREIMARIVQDIDEQEISVSWFMRPGRAEEMAAGGKGLHPHPRNGPNRKAEAHLKTLEERMQAEVLAWESEKQDLAEFDAETDRLIALFTEGKLDELEVLAETQRPAGALLPPRGEEEAELDEEDAKAREEAEAAMSWAQALDSGLLAHHQQEADEAAVSKASRRQSKGKAKAVALPSSQADLDGSEHDKRLEDVEFNVDLLRQDAHSYSQLSSLAARYLQVVSSRASRALDERSSSAALTAASAAASTGDSSDKRRQQQNVARLMQGVNVHRNATHLMGDNTSQQAVDAGTAAKEDTSSRIDPADLLQAFAASGKHSRSAGGSGAQRPVR